MSIHVVTDSATYEKYGFEMHADPQATFDAARTALMESNTARKILERTEGNPQYPIHIFVTKVFPSQFMDADMNQNEPKGSWITWEADYRLALPGGSQEPYMALIHELGHAVQYMENQGWYKSYTRRALAQDFDCIGDPQRKKNAQKVIEDDNIKTHEKPVAEELSQPTRDAY